MAVAAVWQRQQPQTANASTFKGTRSGIEYDLGQKIGAGGNGVVYAVSRHPELVAKIQKAPLSQHDIDKLELMARGATPELLAVAAWPTDLLKTPNGRVVGFAMTRILEARPLYELYSPRSRLQHFPAADFRFLVHTAANVARLFAAVHKAGFICGDVNHSNVLVRQTGTVAAVDCDSFQVGDGSRFPCLVGTDMFVPPELLGMDFRSVRRSVNHDNYGLAVLLFQLLIMGRHPFAGRFLGRGDMPIERAIVEGRYAYSQDKMRTQMEPPPLTPPITTVGTAVMALFEQAFHPKSGKTGRPSPESWIDALDALKLSLIQCKAIAWHYHPTTVRCPWCEIENAARLKLFGGVVRIATAGLADLETLWARYLALVEPGQLRPLPNLPPKPRRPSVLAATWARMQHSVVPKPARAKSSIASRLLGLIKKLDARIGIALTVMVLLWFLPIIGEFFDRMLTLSVTPVDFVSRLLITPTGLAVLVSLSVTLVLAGPFAVALPRFVSMGSLRAMTDAWSFARALVHVSRARRSKRRQYADAELDWLQAAAAWRILPPPPDVSYMRSPIEALKVQLDRLAVERDAAIKACMVIESEEAQRARHLAHFRIEDAKLINVGPARCAVLRSWGIDTAADVEEAKIAVIPGFGRTLTDKLIIWRERMEKSFAPTAASTVDPHDVQQIDRGLAARRTRLMTDLRENIAELERSLGDYTRQRDQLWAKAEVAHRAMEVSIR